MLASHERNFVIAKGTLRAFANNAKSISTLTIFFKFCQLMCLCRLRTFSLVSAKIQAEVFKKKINYHDVSCIGTVFD